MIKGLNHITISTNNLIKSMVFYKETLGFKLLMSHSKGAYFLAGNCWFCLDLDNNTRSGPPPEYTHFAFSILQDDFPKMRDRIMNSGSIIWKENVSEGDSIYFLDPDGHKLEIHVGDWKSRLTSIEQKPWNDSVQIFYKNEDSKNDVSIRRAIASESNLLSGLAIRSKFYWPFPLDYLQQCISVLKISAQDIEEWPVFVAEKDSEILGFFALKEVSGENQLDHLWIDPRFIGQGIGRLLVASSLLEAKKLGWKSYKIVADPYAEKFYKKMGACRIGSIPSRIKPDLLFPYLEIPVN